MTVLDNIMTGRITKMKANFSSMRCGSAGPGRRNWSTARKWRR
jgi:hypothetical protein